MKRAEDGVAERLNDRRTEGQSDRVAGKTRRD